LLAKTLDAVIRLGGIGPEIAVRLDLARALGPRHTWRRLREERQARTRGDLRDQIYYRIWAEAAREVGAEVTRLSGSSFLELTRGGSSTRVWHHWVSLDDVVTGKLALQKPIVHQLLLRAGLPVPRHREFSARDPRSAIDFLLGEAGACVIKPAGASSGAGTTSGIVTREDVLRATLRAARLDDRLLIERQSEGRVYRLLFLDGELLDVLERDSPSVSGDGRSTIAKLISAENRRRLESAGEEGPMLLAIDLECVLTLRNAGLTLDTVPVDGAVARVKSVTNQNGRKENRSALDRVSAELVAEAAAAAAAVGVRLAGVDVVTRDPKRSLAEAEGVVIEVNATPGLHYHYFVAPPAAARRVAVPILELLLTPVS
jgi:cyanophycin synthetase